MPLVSEDAVHFYGADNSIKVSKKVQRRREDQDLKISATCVSFCTIFIAVRKNLPVRMLYLVAMGQFIGSRLFTELTSMGLVILILISCKLIRQIQRMGPREFTMIAVFQNLLDERQRYTLV